MSPKSFDRLLVPTDFSEFSLASLDYVQSFSHFRNSTVYLMHVVENVPMIAFPAVDLDAETVMINAEEDAKSDLDDIVKKRAGGLEKIVQVIRRGVPYKEITQFAKTANVDLIVIATHGRTGVAHAIMGSVAEKVIRHSSVPVLTVKPAEIQARHSETDSQQQMPFTK